ncbi:MAG: hypothetical protein DI582_10905 [Azospirillum brasilense]|nr:MAG: hypothetical protein DI582_10905 [Azospirillum brasilense]
MWNQWFCKWHYIKEQRGVQVDGFDGRKISLGGIDYSGTAIDVYWDAIQRYLLQKVDALFTQLEEELKQYPLDVRVRALNESEGLIISFANKIRRDAAKKDRVLRGDGFTFPAEHDRGSWFGARQEDIKARAETLRSIYCQPRIDIGGNDMPFRDMMNDRITYVKNGEIVRENIPAVVSGGNKAHVDVVDLPFEKGDHILRQLPNGLVEDYIIEHPKFTKGMAGAIPDFYELHLRRSGEPVASPQTIIAHISGAHARMYVNSTDNSVNVTSSTITTEQLGAFLAQVKPNLAALPEDKRAAAAEAVAVLEAEAASTTPSQSKIRTALQSLKTVCEGAAGNIIASGILGLITQLL